MKEEEERRSFADEGLRSNFSAPSVFEVEMVSSTNLAAGPSGTGNVSILEYTSNPLWALSEGDQDDSESDGDDGEVVVVSAEAMADEV